MTKINICAGLSMPYYPPRPTQGSKIAGPSALSSIDRNTYVVQGKLNGDRACALVLGGKVHVQNRHGSWFKHPISNTDKLLKAPDGTLFDGEVLRKEFLPFEAVVVGGKNLSWVGVEDRVAEAQRLCFEMGVPYIFSPELAEPKYWEGYVLKERGSFYIPLGSDGQTTSTWLKRKWTDGSVLTP